MKVVGYARTSWEEQEEGSRPSVEAQEQELRAFAARTGLTLETVYKDTGLGPRQGTCAGLVSMLDDMSGDWEGVLVRSRCRLTDHAMIDDAVEELEENGQKQLITADEATAERLLRRSKRPAAARASGEGAGAGEGEQRREIAQRLLKGREAGARAGKHQSGPAPFGYRRDYSERNTKGVLLVPDEEEADVVRLIFREYLRLRSMKRLIKLLDEQGLRTRRGKRWSRAGVSWILKNDTYVGRVHFGKIRAKGRHESIVPPIVFNKVQKLIRENNKRKSAPARTEQPAAETATAPEPAAPAAEAEAPAQARPRRRRVAVGAGSESG